MKKSLIGNVVSVNNEQLSICGYDYGSDEDREDMYIVTPQTRFSNIGSLDDIARDDQVKVTYEQTRGKNIIVSLVWQGSAWDSHFLIRANFPVLNYHV